MLLHLYRSSWKQKARLDSKTTYNFYCTEWSLSLNCQVVGISLKINISPPLRYAIPGSSECVRALVWNTRSLFRKKSQTDTLLHPCLDFQVRVALFYFICWYFRHNFKERSKVAQAEYHSGSIKLLPVSLLASLGQSLGICAMYHILDIFFHPLLKNSAFSVNPQLTIPLVSSSRAMAIDSNMILNICDKIMRKVLILLLMLAYITVLLWLGVCCSG